jgi:GTP-binding protein EngB required for normal cell division
MAMYRIEYYTKYHKKEELRNILMNKKEINDGENRDNDDKNEENDDKNKETNEEKEDDEKDRKRSLGEDRDKNDKRSENENSSNNDEDKRSEKSSDDEEEEKKKKKKKIEEEEIELNDSKEEKLKKDIESYLKNNLNEREIYDQNINYLKVNPWVFGGISFTGLGTTLTTIVTSCLVDSIVLGTCESGFASILAVGAFSISSLGLVALSGFGIFLLLGGLGIKSIYEKRKYNKIKEYMEKMENNENNSMKEEREIYFHIIYELINYYITENELSELKKNKDIINISDNYVNILNKEIKQKLNEIPNEINNFNVLLLGNTGVGKSTLINKFLKLEKNLCKIGSSARPERIDEWKRYPLNDNDNNSKYKGIYLYDSSGIESGNIDQHLEIVNNFIEKNKSETEKQIHCIWFCIHKPKFDEFEEKYINNLLEIYDSKEKIPIIFIFTKAYIT